VGGAGGGVILCAASAKSSSLGCIHIILTAILTLSDDSRILYFGRQKKAECKFETRLFDGNVMRFFVRIACAFEPEGEAMEDYATAVTCVSLKASEKAFGFPAPRGASD
jgi:hypothetical protein